MPQAWKVPSPQRSPTELKCSLFDTDPECQAYTLQQKQYIKIQVLSQKDKISIRKKANVKFVLKNIDKTYTHNDFLCI